MRATFSTGAIVDAVISADATGGVGNLSLREDRNAAEKLASITPCPERATEHYV